MCIHVREKVEKEAGADVPRMGKMMTAMVAAMAPMVRERKKSAMGPTRLTAAATATVSSSCRQTIAYTLRMKAHRSCGLSIMYGYMPPSAPGG
jgi:hypothetical protein